MNKTVSMILLLALAGCAPDKEAALAQCELKYMDNSTYPFSAERYFQEQQVGRCMRVNGYELKGTCSAINPYCYTRAGFWL